MFTFMLTCSSGLVVVTDVANKFYYCGKLSFKVLFFCSYVFLLFIFFFFDYTNLLSRHLKPKIIKNEMKQKRRAGVNEATSREIGVSTTF